MAKRSVLALTLAALLLLAAGWCWGRAGAGPKVIEVVFRSGAEAPISVTYGLVMEGQTWVPLRALLDPPVLRIYEIEPTFLVQWRNGRVELSPWPEKPRVQPVLGLPPVSPPMDVETCDE